MHTSHSPSPSSQSPPQRTATLALDTLCVQEERYRGAIHHTPATPVAAMRAVRVPANDTTDAAACSTPRDDAAAPLSPHIRTGVASTTFPTSVSSLTEASLGTASSLPVQGPRRPTQAYAIPHPTAETTERDVHETTVHETVVIVSDGTHSCTIPQGLLTRCMNTDATVPHPPTPHVDHDECAVTDRADDDKGAHGDFLRRIVEDDHARAPSPDVTADGEDGESVTSMQMVAAAMSRVLHIFHEPSPPPESEDAAVGRPRRSAEAVTHVQTLSPPSAAGAEHVAKATPSRVPRRRLRRSHHARSSAAYRPSPRHRRHRGRRRRHHHYNNSERGVVVGQHRTSAAAGHAAKPTSPPSLHDAKLREGVPCTTSPTRSSPVAGAARVAVVRLRHGGVSSHTPRRRRVRHRDVAEVSRRSSSTPDTTSSAARSRRARAHSSSRESHTSHRGGVTPAQPPPLCPTDLIAALPRRRSITATTPSCTDSRRGASDTTSSRTPTYTRSSSDRTSYSSTSTATTSTAGVTELAPKSGCTAPPLAVFVNLDVRLGALAALQHYAEPACIYEWDVTWGVWERVTTRVVLGSMAFAKGTMRASYHVIDLERPRCRLVAKRYLRTAVGEGQYVDDAAMYAIAGHWARLFNSLQPPKRVRFVPAAILQLPDRVPPLTLALEPLLEGTFCKYNNNYGYVPREVRWTPQAFSHFTYHASHHELMITDIQGVGDIYTDPQILSADGEGYGKGNLGRRGMRRFLRTHRCNPVCHALHLPDPATTTPRRHHRRTRHHTSARARHGPSPRPTSRSPCVTPTSCSPPPPPTAHIEHGGYCFPSHVCAERLPPRLHRREPLRCQVTTRAEPTPKDSAGVELSGESRPGVTSSRHSTSTTGLMAGEAGVTQTTTSSPAVVSLRPHPPTCSTAAVVVRQSGEGGLVRQLRHAVAQAHASPPGEPPMTHLPLALPTGNVPGMSYAVVAAGSARPTPAVSLAPPHPQPVFSAVEECPPRRRV